MKNKDAVATQLYFFLNKAVVKQHLNIIEINFLTSTTNMQDNTVIGFAKEIPEMCEDPFLWGA